MGEFDAIVDQMTIPVVQGMLKYAFESDPAATDGKKYCNVGAGDACDKALAEGWAFAAAVLPRLNYCDLAVAKLVKENLDVTAITGATTQGNTHMTSGYATLKAEVEKTYPCLGITCDEVGVFQSSGTPFGGMTKCSDASTASSGSSGSSGSADAATTAKPVVDSDSGAVVAAFAMVLLNAYI